MLARARQIAKDAADGLADVSPHLSIKEGASLAQRGLLLLSAAPVGFVATLHPGVFFGALALMLGIVYLAMVVVRLAAAQNPAPVTGSVPRWSERALPVYTVIVPLRREKRVLPRLVGALSSIDYPALWSKCTKGAAHPCETQLSNRYRGFWV